MTKDSREVAHSLALFVGMGANLKQGLAYEGTRTGVRAKWHDGPGPASANQSNQWEPEAKDNAYCPRKAAKRHVFLLYLVGMQALKNNLTSVTFLT